MLLEYSTRLLFWCKISCVRMSFSIPMQVLFDLSLARGLDYYTGVIFEAVLSGQYFNTIVFNSYTCHQPVCHRNPRGDGGGDTQNWLKDKRAP